MTPYRVLITGSRHWHCLDVARLVVSRLRDKHGPNLVIVHGDAPGVDRAFRDACESLGVEHEPHPADWQGKGKAAGPIRNSEMVAAGADICIGCSTNLDKSRGTRDCVGKALRAGIPVWLIDGEYAEIRPKRITDLSEARQ